MIISLLLILTSFSFGISSIDILDILGDDVNWELKSIKNRTKIFSYKNKETNLNIIKIEQKIENINNQEIFDVIKDINNYNNIISNSSLDSKLVRTFKDTLWVYQSIKNSIPFTRDRQYVFKMYNISPDKLVWIIDEKYKLSNKANSQDSKTLKIGAGIWEFEYEKNKKFLVNKIYVNDEINIPELFIEKLRREHVYQIFEDIMNVVTENKERGVK